jgi:DNA (cytosine-5)-methyltransferase 1
VAVILVAVAKLLWFVKSKRAQTSDDDETWIAGGVAPTLNAFDMGDTRATVIIFEATRVDDVRIYENYSPTVATYWGTGGARVPYVFPIQGTVIGRSDEAGPMGKGYADDGEVMFTLDRVSSHAVAFDTFNQTVSDTSQTIKAHSANNETIGTVFQTSTVRRLTPTECERLQGFPDGWTDGQADSHRYKQMGNAVAVPVVEWIINRIIK